MLINIFTEFMLLNLCLFNFLVDIDECASSPCMNEGECFNEVAMFTCTCAPGWEGVTCDGKCPEYIFKFARTKKPIALFNNIYISIDSQSNPS